MQAANQVQQAVYDGPIDSRTFDYQPVILEKLPSLADGDAILETVTVETGDLVVNDAGNPVTLEEGVLVQPAGCHDTECAIAYDGTSVEMEQMVVMFKLFEGILWSDGEPLTSYDSIYSFDVNADPDTPATKYTIDRTASYDAPDDFTVVWRGLPGYRDSQYQINFWTPLPEHVWGDYTALELLEAEESSRMPLGWGAYVMDEWVAGDHITLHKNDLYWRADEGLPHIPHHASWTQIVLPGHHHDFLKDWAILGATVRNFARVTEPQRVPVRQQDSPLLRHAIQALFDLDKNVSIRCQISLRLVMTNP